MSTVTRAHGRFIVRWPIEDQTCSVAELKAEAKERIFEAMNALRLRAEEMPAVKVFHDQHPNIQAQIDVSWTGSRLDPNSVEL
ncbi:hypothetical protein [Micrococcus lylae]|uniref:hypothetical protein n=1 Tax=Micrococcus lylae TaxID=1273 RepID=UPI000C80DC77|nr:hypothetical protein [Micrococcus lylae]WIK82135.1 hypothetical protein CJ228_011205 [Micrococcus lylae]